MSELNIDFEPRGKLPEYPSADQEKVLRVASADVVLADGTPAYIIATQLQKELGGRVAIVINPDRENPAPYQTRKLEIQSVWLARGNGSELMPANVVSPIKRVYNVDGEDIVEPLLSIPLDYDGPDRSDPRFVKWAGLPQKRPQ